MRRQPDIANGAASNGRCEGVGVRVLVQLALEVGQLVVLRHALWLLVAGFRIESYRIHDRWERESVSAIFADAEGASAIFARRAWLGCQLEASVGGLPCLLSFVGAAFRRAEEAMKAWWPPLHEHEQSHVSDRGGNRVKLYRSGGAAEFVRNKLGSLFALTGQLDVHCSRLAWTSSIIEHVATSVTTPKCQELKAAHEKCIAQLHDSSSLPSNTQCYTPAPARGSNADALRDRDRSMTAHSPQSAQR